MKNNSIKIQVLGSGCPTCKKLYELTKEAIVEINFNVDVEYVTDIQKIVAMGVMQSPVLAINGKPIMTGSIFDKEKIKELIKNWCEKDNEKDKDGKSNKCSCDGNC